MYYAYSFKSTRFAFERERERGRERERALTDPEGRVRKVATPPINLFPPLKVKMKGNK